VDPGRRVGAGRRRDRRGTDAPARLRAASRSSRARARLAADVVAADLGRLAALQQDDGGWPVEWATFSPASTLEWRGHLTVKALTTLQRDGWLTR
jgi:hypothetical protein